MNGALFSLFIHGLSLVNAQMIIAFGTALYAIIAFYFTMT